jgi:antitoxin HigA-1
MGRGNRRLPPRGIMAKRQIPLATPGEILPEEFLKLLGVTQYRLAKEIGVPQRRIGEMVAGKRAITADTAVRLGVFFAWKPSSG